MWSELHDIEEFKEAILCVSMVVNKNRGRRVFVHGHSLGGTKACVADHWLGEHVAGGHVFNPGSGFLEPGTGLLLA